MRLQIFCEKCFDELDKVEFEGYNLIPKEALTWVEFREDSKYELTCHRGHHLIHLLRDPKFEILFDIGLNAVLDGYYREAISSFTSSLERFYEFFIRVLLLSKGIEFETIESTWKLVSNQSERQLGAFIFLHVQEFGGEPILLTNSKVKLRNEVIHKGKIPSRDEAVQYGQAVMDVIHPLLTSLKHDHKGCIDQLESHYLDKVRTQGGGQAKTMRISRTLTTTKAKYSYEERSVEQVLANLASKR